MAKKKRYSPDDKYTYHLSRDISPSLTGLKFGSARHLYSTGFVDAFDGRDNASAVKKQFGAKSAAGYRFGYKRGQACKIKKLKTKFKK